MNRTLALALALPASLLALSPALAQDDAPFTGPRVGFEAGWARLSGGDHRRADGFSYGLAIGYDIDAGPVRIGPEVKLADSTQEHCRNEPTGGPSARICRRSDRDIYLGARLGVVASPQVLIFGTGGYTNGRFSDHYRDYTVGSIRDGDHGRDIGGYRLGGGIEYALNSNLYLTGTYQYSGWKHKDWTRHVHQNQLLTGVGYRF